MNKKTKYYFLIKNILLFFILNLGLGFVNRVLDSYSSVSPDVIELVISFIGIIKVLLVIALVAGTIYLVYLIILYLNSSFYSEYHVSVFEAIYHGFMDVYQIYDMIKRSSKVKELNMEFKDSTIYFSTMNNDYSVIFIDLFGKVEGRIDSEFWAKVSKPQKKYNQKVYTKREKFPNPFKVNQEFISELNSKTNKKYKNYVVISGFYNMDNKSKKIIAPYELIDLINE